MTEIIPELPLKQRYFVSSGTAVLPVEQGALIAVCAFCGASNAVDKSEVVLHFAARETLREPEAAAALRRWMGATIQLKSGSKSHHRPTSV
ncbi:MAG: hypothetical protein M5U34_34840 [Chloroflexi bacterium]|nr:hypothetical protein [Chloroflexota bacterium]